jgi:hypothetical protein
MKDLYKEKIKVVADRNGWSPTHAHGYVDGDIARRRGATPSKYAQVGIDEYCLGFREGYYERKKPEPVIGNAAALPGRWPGRVAARAGEL